MRNQVELLAPAGSYEGLKQAIDAGADAVFLGGKLFGARAYAENFSQEELIQAIDYAHLHGADLHLTVNTLVKETEFQQNLYEYLLPLYEAGLDAVIVQDVGVIDFIRRVFPELQVHTSTQLTVTGSDGVAFMESLGATRVVLARELSLDEIKRICSGTSMEIECFVHGALCYCYSGQCLFSSLLGGRSGNRGRCAQPCRLPYRDENGKQAYYLSLRDLCTIDHIPELIEAGITSFKIEGRMKKPEYTAGVTAIYRKYIDLYLTLREQGRAKEFRVSEADRRILHELYSRTKSGTGYYFTRNSRKMLTLDKPSYASDSKAGTLGAKETVDRRIKLNGKLILHREEPVKLMLTLGEGELQAECTSEELVSPAQKQPLEEAQLVQRMRKTGNTPFVIEQLEVELDPNSYCSVKSLNELRRQALGLLEEQYLARYRRTGAAERLQAFEQETETAEKVATTGTMVKIEESVKNGDDSAHLICHVRTEEQMEQVLYFPEVSVLTLEPMLWLHMETGRLQALRDQLHEQSRSLYMALPHIIRHKDRELLKQQGVSRLKLADGILFRNTEGLMFLNDMEFEGVRVSDSNCYTFNRNAHTFWLRYADRDTIPVELNHKEIRIRGLDRSEMIVYGRIPLMITAQCLQQTLQGCNKGHGMRTITDRYNKSFSALQECDFCYNLILNSVPLNLIDEIDDLQNAGCSSFRLHFTLESGREVEDVLSSLRKREKSKGEFTRGHYRRGVE